MDYLDYAYLYPPRPEKAVPADALKLYDRLGWVGQVKKNGTCTVIFARGREVIFKTRHNDDHKQWTPLPEHVKFFQSDSTEWNVYVGELIHNKTPSVKNQLYLFDQIVANGVQLVGVTLAERHARLLSNWATVEEFDQHRASPYVSVAHNFRGGFRELYDRIGPSSERGLNLENEGLVLKDPRARLKPCWKANANAAWQIKSRIIHKNYGF